MSSSWPTPSTPFTGMSRSWPPSPPPALTLATLVSPAAGTCLPAELGRDSPCRAGAWSPRWAPGGLLAARAGLCLHKPERWRTRELPWSMCLASACHTLLSCRTLHQAALWLCICPVQSTGLLAVPIMHPTAARAWSPALPGPSAVTGTSSHLLSKCSTRPRPQRADQSVPQQRPPLPPS